jgi:two-component system NarL family sensor kinase
MTVTSESAAERRGGVRRELQVFCGAAALALLVVAVGAVAASRSVARSQALSDAEHMTVKLAALVVAPLLEDSLNGDVERQEELSRAIDNRMRDGYLRQIIVWDGAGRIVLADDPADVGKQLEPPDEVLRAIEQGAVSSEFEPEPEASHLAAQEKGVGFVEVYVPLTLPGRAPMAFEAYYDYARVDETAKSLLWQLIPLVLVPLIVLMAIQVPIATSMARRVRRHDAERSELAERSLAASERERIRIAADLHDGPIQDLAGTSYALGAVAGSVPEHHRALMATLQRTVQRSIESLRQLMVDLYPPDLGPAQLPDSLSKLAEPLRRNGTDVTVSVGDLPPASDELFTTIYRVTQEALANIAKHAAATRVVVSLHSGRDDDEPSLQLRIVDDGVGFNPDKLDRRAEGHLGLQLLRSRVEGLGGSFAICAMPGGGTSITADLPLPSPLPV